MKKILTFKLFESSEEEDIKKGFKFSEQYIRDRIYYLTDIGFSLDDDKIESIYINESGSKVRLIDATKSVYFLKLTRNLDSKLKYRSVETSSYPRSSKTYYYLNNTEDLLELAEEIASFSAHFDDIYHNITYDSKSIEISFYIYSEISNDVKENEKSAIINNKVREQISNSIYRFSQKFSDTKIGLTKKFKEESNRNKLGGILLWFFWW